MVRNGPRYYVKINKIWKYIIYKSIRMAIYSGWL